MTKERNAAAVSDDDATQHPDTAGQNRVTMDVALGNATAGS